MKKNAAHSKSPTNFARKDKEAAAEFIENAEFAESLDEYGSSFSFEDAILLAEHIEIPDSEIDDSWLSLEFIEEFYEETPEEREAIVNKIFGEIRFEEDEVSAERISTISRILKMRMKDRVKLAMKGDREARNILIRDPNRMVCQAVIQNPRITEHEVEKIASMRTVPEDVLRQIAINRNWARNYMIMHTLAHKSAHSDRQCDYDFNSSPIPRFACYDQKSKYSRCGPKTRLAFNQCPHGRRKEVKGKRWKS